MSYLEYCCGSGLRQHGRGLKFRWRGALTLFGLTVFCGYYGLLTVAVVACGSMEGVCS
jgi:hypothetical protein